MQLLSAAGSVLPSSILPDSPSHMSVLPGPLAPAHCMSPTEDDDIPETLQAMPGTAVRLSVEADNPSNDAAANLQQQPQAEPSASATSEEWAQTSAQIQEEYAKFPVLGMINLQDVPPNIKSQVQGLDQDTHDSIHTCETCRGLHKCSMLVAQILAAIAITR